MTKQKIYLALLLCLSVVMSCNDDPSYKKISDLSPEAQRFMEMRLNARLSYDQANAVQQNQFRAGLEQRVFAHGRVKGDSAAGDSTGYDPWEWVTCATVTNTTDELGGQTTVVDYGEGCEEGRDDWKYWMQGKLTYYFRNKAKVSGSQTNYEYESRASYDNYGGRYVFTDTVEWVTNGKGHYLGHATYDEASNMYVGGYTNEDSVVYNYNRIATTYRSNSQSTFDQKSWVLKESDCEYSYGDDYYHTTVLSPLVWSYTCEPWVVNSFISNGNESNYNYVGTYVSGKEVIIYRYDGVEGSFTIDYGNGECDNIIYITEDGETARIDLGEYWKICY